MSPASGRPKPEYLTSLFRLRRSDPSHLTANGEGPENTIIERGDETTNSTVPTVVEEHLLTSSGRARSGEETCGVVQPQTANNYLHGTEQGTEELGVDVLAEHLLKGFEVRQVTMIVAFAIILYYTYNICSHVIQV